MFYGTRDSLSSLGRIPGPTLILSRHVSSLAGSFFFMHCSSLRYACARTKNKAGAHDQVSNCIIYQPILRIYRGVTRPVRGERRCFGDSNRALSREMPASALILRRPSDLPELTSLSLFLWILESSDSKVRRVSPALWDHTFCPTVYWYSWTK